MATSKGSSIVAATTSQASTATSEVSPDPSNYSGTTAADVPCTLTTGIRPTTTGNAPESSDPHLQKSLLQLVLKVHLSSSKLTIHLSLAPLTPEMLSNLQRLVLLMIQHLQRLMDNLLLSLQRALMRRVPQSPLQTLTSKAPASLPQPPMSEESTTEDIHRCHTCSFMLRRQDNTTSADDIDATGASMHGYYPVILIVALSSSIMM